jgi:predicted aspartyl protease/uncharacterized membrane protein YphA (DoxX/SURF4 family)
MKGFVDNSGRALSSVELRKTVRGDSTRIDDWGDTGFTGDLVIPVALINTLELEPSGSVDTIFANGSQIALSTYSRLIGWFGRTKKLEAIANEGECPLLRDNHNQEPGANPIHCWKRVVKAINPLARLGFTRFGLLCVATTAQILTIFLTWPLWQVRGNHLPNLPLIEFLSFDYGTIVLASTILVLLMPHKGIWINLGVFAIASVSDQMRLQPQFLANWVLMFATVSPNGTRVGRLLLISLWFWAGLHKFISPDWFTQTSWVLTSEAGFSPENSHYLFAVAAIVSEVGLGILAFLKPRWAAIACPFLHVGIVIFLSPLFRGLNYSVIPWNLSTAVVGCWILWVESERAKWNLWEYCLLAILMTAPAGFYLGIVDHGYAHVLYSDNLPRGHITQSDGEHYEIVGWEELAVPFPNERRLLKQYFETVSQPGDKLHICDPRPFLDDQFFVMTDSNSKEIDKQQFFGQQDNVAPGVGIDSMRSVYWLRNAKVRMLARKNHDMVYAVEFNASNYSTELLRLATELPNLEQIQLCIGQTEDVKTRFAFSIVNEVV